MYKIYFLLCLYVSIVLSQNGKGTIYLTFDDGPINATAELIEVLNDAEVKATFFVNGFHLYGEGDENEDKAKESLESLVASGHIIGNHSYDHMLHNCSDGKRSGAAYCNEVGLWPVGAYGDPLKEYEYFTLNISRIYEKVPTLKTYQGNKLTSLVRMPYTNSWRVSKALRGDALCATSDSLVPWDANFVCDPDSPCQSVKNAIALADLLEKKGYKAYGWDLDWGPTDWGVKHPTESLDDGKRLLKKVKELLDKPATSTMLPINSRCHTINDNAFEHKGKVIILAHDFLFENGNRGQGATINLPKLANFIKLAKSEGYQFETLDNYLQ